MEPQKLNLWQRFLLFWKFRYQYYPRNFIVGVGNLIKWAPVIWKDRDWDQHYILEVLKFKIKKTANLFEKNQRFVGWESQVHYMRICEKLIELIQDEYYSHEYFDYYDNKFSFEKTEDSDHFELKSEVTRDDLQTYIQKYPHAKRAAIINPKYNVFINSMSGSPDVGMSIAIGMVRHNKAKKLLFNILENKIEHWWD